ncbi:cytochrome b [Undibacterium sp. Ji22W]|uniref:cytochrome b n=1 Tax=Undibacterium sp. Ji22W TaxID=3413038 RepID=UPI003BEFCB1C
MDQQHQLSKTSVVLHWLIALVMIILSVVGLVMSEKEIWFLYPIHKSIGTLIFALILIRVVWRMRQGWPKPIRPYAQYEQVLSKTVHWILITGTVLMPISGMLMSAVGGHGIALFGWELVAEHHSLTQPDQALPYSEFWAGVGESGHTIIAYVLIAAIALHIAGALKHHIIDRDATLRRMLGQHTSDQ